MSGSERHSVAEVARILGISEQGVRDRIERGTLNAVKAGKAWRIILPPEADAVAPTASSGSASGSPAVGDAVATPLLVEAAIQRTGQQYTSDLRAILGDLRAVYEGQIEAKDAALAAKEETIAELRRRAEAAEAERDRLAAAQDGPGTPGAPAEAQDSRPRSMGAGAALVARSAA